MNSLKQQKKIIEKNIKFADDMVKNNKTYTGADGKTYDASHYKKAAEYDRQQLKKVKDLMQREQKINKIKSLDIRNRDTFNLDYKTGKQQDKSPALPKKRK